MYFKYDFKVCGIYVGCVDRLFGKEEVMVYRVEIKENVS